MRRLNVIPPQILIIAQVSSVTASYHDPQFRVVPAATVAFTGGATIVIAYSSILNGLVVVPPMVVLVELYIPP